MDEKLGNLIEKLICVKGRITGLAVQMLDNDKFNEEKRQLKISLKKGDIDNKEYENKLHALRKELKQFDLESWTCRKSFLDQFSMVVPVGTQEEVMDIIEQKKSLTGHSI